MKGYKKYFGKKIIWFLITLVFAVLLNFILPRLMPANPVATITGKLVGGSTDAAIVQQTYEQYMKEFGLDKSMPERDHFLLRGLDHRFAAARHPRGLDPGQRAGCPGRLHQEGL